MERFLQYAVSGFSTGSVYALVALGLVLIYRSTRILHFAHGDITTAGTFIAFFMLEAHLPFGVAAVGGLLFGAAIAMTFYFVILVPAQRRGSHSARSDNSNSRARSDHTGVSHLFRGHGTTQLPLPVI